MNMQLFCAHIMQVARVILQPILSLTTEVWLHIPRTRSCFYYENASLLEVFFETDQRLITFIDRLWNKEHLILIMQVRIQDFVKGGPQVLRPKIADIAKRSRASEASNLRPGSRAHLRALEAFGFLMLKYAFSHILETLFL